MSARNSTVLVCIEDPILSMDIESAFTSAGYCVVRATSSSNTSYRQGPIAVGLVDADQRDERTVELLRFLIDTAVPCVLFTSDESDGILNLSAAGVERVAKPLMSDQILARVERLIAKARGQERTWTDDAPAARSDIG